MSEDRFAAIEERLNKLEKTKKVKLPKSDRPKKAKSAYQFYVQETGPVVRDEWIKEGREFKQTDIMKEVGVRWKGLSEESKKSYNDMAKAEKESMTESS